MKADGTHEYIEPANGKEWQLGELQKLVGGLIETFPTPKEDVILVLHEEGKLTVSPTLNMEATVLVREFLMDNDWIAGDAVVVTKKSLGE